MLTNTYDGMGRVTRKRLGLNSNYNTEMTYVLGANNSRTTLLATYQNGSDAAYEYAYDDNGNISSITRGTTSVTYQYNGANELVRENNGFTNQTVTYEYDVWGNLRFKKTYAYTTIEEPTDPTDTKIYGYSTGEWKDQLLTFGAETIVYDAMGNPTSYRGKSLTWRGKQLTGVSDTAHNLSATYTYDTNGLRQQKTVNNVDTDYYYNGSVLIGLVKGNDTLRFSYDAAGMVQAVDFNGVYYYYLRNGQGDIVKLIDNSGATKVEYTYDSWGKPLSCTGTLATSLGALNPFRYRGYVYDEETQWYYLKSRYYDPETCRFISADVLLSTGQGVLGHNCYAYCLNNPANLSDSLGHRPAKGAINPDGDKEQDDRSPLYFGEGEEKQAIAALQQGYDVYYRSVHLVLLSPDKGLADASFSVFQTIYWYPYYGEDENHIVSTLKHEYGHTVQEKRMGERNYFMFVVVPSVGFHFIAEHNDFFDRHYYDQPWERGADYYGQVKEGEERSHSFLSSILWKPYDFLARLTSVPVY